MTSESPLTISGAYERKLIFFEWHFGSRSGLLDSNLGTHTHSKSAIDGSVHGWLNAQMDGSVDGWIDGSMDGWMDK